MDGFFDIHKTLKHVLLLRAERWHLEASRVDMQKSVVPYETTRTVLIRCTCTIHLWQTTADLTERYHAKDIGGKKTSFSLIYRKYKNVHQTTLKKVRIGDRWKDRSKALW